MKFALVLLVVAIAISSSSAQFGRGIGRGIGGIGGIGRGIGGIGIGGRFGGIGGRFGLGLGGLGFGGLGFGGLGFGLGFPFGGLGLLGMMGPWGMPGLIGKRDLETIQKEFDLSHDVTKCTYVSETNTIKCEGTEKNTFECDVKSEFISWTPTTTHVIKNLTALPESTQVKEDSLIFNLFSFDKKTEEINDYTFLDTHEGKEKKVEFSLFFKADKDESDGLNGLRFKEGSCWSKFVRVVGSSMPGNVQFTLHFAKHHEAKTDIE